MMARPAVDATHTEAECPWPWIELPDDDAAIGIPDIALVSLDIGDSEPRPPVIWQESEAGE